MKGDNSAFRVGKTHLGQKHNDSYTPESEEEGAVPFYPERILGDAKEVILYPLTCKLPYPKRPRAVW